MRTPKAVRNGMLVIGALCASIVAPAQQATHQLQVLYVIPQGQVARPQAEDAIAAMMAILQKHYYRQLGVTFELKTPLVTKVSVPEYPQATGLWSKTYELVQSQLPVDYVLNNNIVVVLTEGSREPADGSRNIVNIGGGTWTDAYATYINTPHLLPQKMPVFAYALGRSFGLSDSAVTKQCMAWRAYPRVDMGTLPSLLMQMTDDLGTVYNYAFHEVEKKMLTDPSYYPSCRAWLYERPHSSAYLKLNSLPTYPAVTARNVNVIEYGTRDGRRLGQFMQLDKYTWVEQNAAGLPIRTLQKHRRLGTSVYLTNPGYIQLNLETKKVVDLTTGVSNELYTILNASGKMNGRLASRVYFTNNWRGDETGVFVRSADGTWLEQSLPVNRTLFRFREIGRDDWSVYLFDESRNLYIQLDMHTERVNFRMGHEREFRGLYNILLAQ